MFKCLVQQIFDFSFWTIQKIHFGLSWVNRLAFPTSSLDGTYWLDAQRSPCSTLCVSSCARTTLSCMNKHTLANTLPTLTQRALLSITLSLSVHRIYLILRVSLHGSVNGGIPVIKLKNLISVLLVKCDLTGMCRFAQVSVALDY